MSDGTPAFVIGDSAAVYEVPIVDGDGRARDISGWAVKLFAKGRLGDTPGSAVSVTTSGWTMTAGSKIVTLGNTTGFGSALGWRIVNAKVPAGTWIKSVDTVGASGQFTMSDAAQVSGTGESITFWKGIDADLSLASQGRARFIGLGALLALGALVNRQDTYDDEIWTKDGSGNQGVSSPSEFIARRPIG